MKKKMTILAVLVAAVAITTSQVAGTYAKYTSDLGEVSDTARVAKWSVGTLKKVDIFSQYYGTKGTALEEDTNAVISSSKDKIVAPGSKGTYNFTIDGKFETETNYIIKANVTLTDKNTNGVSNPIKLKFKGFDGIEESTAYSATELSGIISKLFQDSKGSPIVYKAGTEPTFGTYSIEWEWPFDGTDDTDTKLGKSVNGVSDPTFTFTVQLTAEQTLSEPAAE